MLDRSFAVRSILVGFLLKGIFSPAQTTAQVPPGRQFCKPSATLVVRATGSLPIRRRSDRRRSEARAAHPPLEQDGRLGNDITRTLGLGEGTKSSRPHPVMEA